MFFKTYFTSSESVKSDISLYGVESFDFKIRKVFDPIDYNSWQECVDASQKWEVCVLRRMNVLNRDDCYNKHYNKGFVVLYGDDNYSRHPSVRLKISTAAKSRTPEMIAFAALQRSNLLRYKAIFKLLKSRNSIKIGKKYIKQYTRYIEYISINRPSLTRIKSFLLNLIVLCNIVVPRKVYNRVKSRGAIPKEVGEKISKSKTGWYYYTNIESGEIKMFHKDDNIPIGWIRKMHTDEAKESIRKSSTGRKHNQDTKDSVSKSRKGSMYFTNPELTEYKQFNNIDDVPVGWIRGIKVSSRNNKISKNNRWKT